MGARINSNWCSIAPPIVIEHASADPRYCNHEATKRFQIESYVSVPIIRATGGYFGNLSALAPSPAKVSEPRFLSMFIKFCGTHCLSCIALRRYWNNRFPGEWKSKTALARLCFYGAEAEHRFDSNSSFICVRPFWHSQTMISLLSRAPRKGADGRAPALLEQFNRVRDLLDCLVHTPRNFSARPFGEFLRARHNLRWYHFGQLLKLG